VVRIFVVFKKGNLSKNSTRKKEKKLFTNINEPAIRKCKNKATIACSSLFREYA